MSTPPRIVGNPKRMKKNCLTALPFLLLFMIVIVMMFNSKQSIDQLSLRAYCTNNNSRQRSNDLLSTLNIVFGLSGNHPGFLSEFEVALKSVLLHAPLERAMHVYIVADGDAYQSLDDVFKRTNILTWETRNPIKIYVYDLSSKLPQLESLIVETFSHALNNPNFTLEDATWSHTVGCFFRLYAHRVLPATVTHFLYLDTDVVIMANLEGLWQQIDITSSSANALFYWGRGMCAGFVIFNLQRMDELWTLAQTTPMQNISEVYQQEANDQLVLLALNVTYPNQVAIFGDGWEMTVSEKWINNDKLVELYPDVGMLHFNGGGDDEAYWTKHTFISGFSDTWRNGNYSASMPWPWARYQAKTMVRPGLKGYMMNITFV